MKHLLQIVLRKYEFFHISYLHSTMVLFKYELVNYGNIGKKKFTFHYGPIQMGTLSDWAAGEYIYIPLWSYSNLIYLMYVLYSLIFTFHYGPIQIALMYLRHKKFQKFTFHYGPIQIIFF